MFITKKKRKNGGVFYTSKREKPKSIFITKKGNRNIIDLEKLEKVIIELSNHPNAKLKKLRGKLREVYNQAVVYVELFYGHEHYSVLIELIEKYFKKYKHIMPGTIAAYMYGCSINTNLDNDSCSPLCAGSVKLDPDSPFCDIPVIIAEYSKSAFYFNIQNDNDHGKVAFVYVSFNSLRTFPGFDDKEKDWFRRNGYKTIYLYGTVNNSGKYVNLYSNENDDGTINVENIKSRIGTVKPTNTTLTINNSIFIVLAIVVVLFVVYFVYQYIMARRHKQKS